MNWVRVNKANPCPVCAGTTWCGVSTDGKLCNCTRTPSVKELKSKSGDFCGYLHKLSGDTPAPKPREKKQKPVSQTDLFALHEAYVARCSVELLGMLSNSLHVSAQSLRRLECGYDGLNYSFPMRDANMRLVGLKLRAPSGAKFCVPGSNLGIYWPGKVKPTDETQLLITEGESDTAALLDLGYDAIGRPSCSGGVEIIKAWLKIGRRRRDVVIVADNDAGKERPDGTKFYPGQDGAAALAKEIHKLTRTLKVVTIPDYKDARQFLIAGKTKGALDCIIKNKRMFQV